ncbi:MAG: hypothetical protein AAGA10_30995 [Bacteroidota bacterium]
MNTSALDQLLQGVIGQGPQAIRALLSRIKEKHFALGEHILALGDVIEHMYYINSGIARHYHINEETEEEGTTWM